MIDFLICFTSVVISGSILCSIDKFHRCMDKYLEEK